MSGPGGVPVSGVCGEALPPASLCEGGGPAGPEGENLAIAQNISDSREVLSPTRCGGSPLPEGGQEGGFPGAVRLRGSTGPGVPGPYMRSVWFTRAPVGISLPGRPRSQRFLTPP